jgi:hypothetical protein
MASDITAPRTVRAAASQRENDAAALIELMGGEVALRHPHVLDDADHAAIRLVLLAQLRDASVLRRFPLVSANEPAFAVVLPGTDW